jgi:hypothetical protein
MNPREDLWMDINDPREDFYEEAREAVAVQIRDDRWTFQAEDLFVFAAFRSIIAGTQYAPWEDPQLSSYWDDALEAELEDGNFVSFVRL